MARIAIIKLIEDSDRVVRRRASITIRRYVPRGRTGRITVNLSTGWPEDKDQHTIADNRAHARALVSQWLAGLSVKRAES